MFQRQPHQTIGADAFQPGQIGLIVEPITGRAPCAGREQPDAVEVITQTDDLSSIERTKIIEVLRREGGNKSRAARALGIDRRKLYRLVEKYGIEV